MDTTGYTIIVLFSFTMACVMTQWSFLACEVLTKFCLEVFYCNYWPTGFSRVFKRFICKSAIGYQLEQTMQLYMQARTSHIIVSNYLISKEKLF